MKTFNDFLNEGHSLEAIKLQHNELQGMAVKDLRAVVAKQNKVIDTTGLNKQDAITRILTDQHGRTRAAAALGWPQ